MFLNLFWLKAHLKISGIICGTPKYKKKSKSCKKDAKNDVITKTISKLQNPCNFNYLFKNARGTFDNLSRHTGLKNTGLESPKSKQF